MKKIIEYFKLFIKQVQQPKYYLISFIVLLCSLYLVLKFEEVLPKRPQSTHQWAQCDRGSVARNFAEQSMNFFKPRVYNCKNLTGITGMEFPIINYTVAIFYKAFGFNDFWYRFIMLVIISFGIYYGVKISNKIINNFFISIFAIFLWYVSPVLNYYSPNFIPDTASLAFAIISWFYFFEYKQNSSRKNIILLGVFLSLSCLIKVASTISLATMLALLFFDQFKLLGFKKEIPQKKFIIITLGIVIALTIGWYQYASWLNKFYDCATFTLTIHPALTKAEIINIWNSLDFWISCYYNKPYYWFIFMSFILILFNFKKINKELFVATTLLYLGDLCFIILFFEQFRNHDYYIITLLLPVLFNIILIIQVVQKLNNKLFKKLCIGILASIFVYSLIFSRNHQNLRYHGWINDPEGISLQYFDIEKTMDKLSISKKERIATLFDFSPNITLYMMNRKGWSLDKDCSDDEIINALKHCQYATVRKIEYIKNKTYSNYFTKLIGIHKGVFIFQLPDSADVANTGKKNNDLNYIFTDSTINCGAEQTTNDNKYFTSQFEKLFQNNNTRTNIKSHTGNYSIVINKNNPYGFLTRFNNINISDSFEIRAWVLEKTKTCSIVVGDEKDFYITSNTETRKDSLGWVLLTMNFTVNRDIKDSKFSVYLLNTDTSKVYCDDMEIKYRRVKISKKI